MSDGMCCFTSTFEISDLKLYDVYYNICIKIFNYRMEHKLTKKALAKILGVSVRTVNNFENGVYDYKVSQLVNISQKLGLEFTISTKA